MSSRIGSRRLFSASFALVAVFMVSSLARADSSSTHESNGALMIDELISIAVRQHPSVRVEFSQEKAARADLDAASLRSLPSISLTAENTPVATTDNQSLAAQKLISVEQTLWSAGREGALVDSANSTAQFHGAVVREVQYQIALRVLESWLGVVQGTFRMREIERTQQRLNEFIEFMERRVTNGVSARIEIELIVARLAQLRVDLQQAKSNMMNSKAKLEVLLGNAYSLEQLIGRLSLKDQAQIVMALDISEYSRRVSEAIEDHPTVQKARYQAQASQFSLKAQRAALWPQVYLRYQKTLSNGPNSYADGFYLGLKYQPGAGFSTFAEAKSAQARADGIAQSIDVAQHGLQDDLSSDIQDIATAGGRILALEQAVEANTRLQESYERQFAAGRRNWIEVMNSVRESNDVRVSLVDARTAILGASYRLRIRMGDLVWQKAPSDALLQ